MAAAVVAGGLLALGVATPSHAEDEVNIDHLESVDGVVSLVLAVDGIPGGVDGRPGHRSRSRSTDGRSTRPPR